MSFMTNPFLQHLVLGWCSLDIMTMYNMLISFENSQGLKCYSRDDDFFVCEVFILNTRLYEAWSSLYYHSILLLY